MTDSEAIEHLKTTTPQVELTRWQRVARVLSAVFAGIGAVALVVAVYAVRSAADASGRSLDVSSCVNETLGIRQQFAVADHKNEAQKIADQKVAAKDQAAGLAQALTGKTKAAQFAGVLLYQRGVNMFVKSLADWQARDKVIAAQRALHPLGRC